MCGRCRSTARMRRARGRKALIDAAGDDDIVGPGSDRGNEMLAHVAAQLDLPMAANVTEVRGDEVTRQRWGGTLLEEARIHAPTQADDRRAVRLRSRYQSATSRSCVRT